MAVQLCPSRNVFAKSQAAVGKSILVPLTPLVSLAVSPTVPASALDLGALLKHRDSDVRGYLAARTEPPRTESVDAPYGCFAMAAAEPFAVPLWLVRGVADGSRANMERSTMTVCVDVKTFMLPVKCNPPWCRVGKSS